MLEEDEALKKARQLILRYLTYRARSKKEAVNYLKKKGFSEKVIEKLTLEMTEYGYLNDHKFTDDFISYRKSQGYGPKRVRHELGQKGIETNLINQKLKEHFNPAEDLARIEEILSRRDNRSRESEANKDRLFRREAAFLQRRGFQDHLILTVLQKKYRNDEQ